MISPCSLIAALALSIGGDDETPSRPELDAFTQGMRAHEGFLDLWWDEAAGKLYAECPPVDERGVSLEFLYVEGLSSGLGSNPVGLDRGRMGSTRLLRLRRLGPKVLIEEQNLRYRARSDRAAERRAVEQSFASSVLHGGRAVAEDPSGRFLVDLSDFLLRDSHGVRRSLRSSDQGSFSLASERCAIEPEHVLCFPDNVEIDTLLTFSAEDPGPQVRATAADGQHVSLRVHHSFIRLPDDDYRPRPAHPDIGFMAVDFQDYAVPLHEGLSQRWILRHRLRKIDPTAARSRVEEPIVYHVDRGAPPQIRDALLDGARWWSQAFERAGLIDAFRVEVLPEGAHPLDVRYNMIHWVHRATRGWSYGGSVHDPRTGEILKGNVRLGSLRVRQDRLLFEGLSDAQRSGRGGAEDPVEIALARIRQLSAHEVGHTLGIVHNFAASTTGRASVMDYPAPWVKVGEGGRLDFTDAYAVGIGDWDAHTIRYGYSDFAPDTDETAALSRIVREGREAGLIYLSDGDARPAAAADPRANLWDNGSDPVAALREAYEVRRIALDKFGPRNLAPGQPLAGLHEVLVPVYLYHRYQVEAAAKVLGGVHYSYERWDGETARPQRVLPGERQREALEALLQAIEPRFLELRPSLRSLLLPRPPGAGRDRELFSGRTAPIFDPLGAASAAADHVLAALLQPTRLHRLAQQHADDPTVPGVDELLRALRDRCFASGVDESAAHGAIRRTVQEALLTRLVRLERDTDTPVEVRDAVFRELRGLHEQLASQEDPRAARPRLVQVLERHFARPDAEVSLPAPAAEMPPGSPIGCGCELLPGLTRE